MSGGGHEKSSGGLSSRVNPMRAYPVIGESCVSPLLEYIRNNHDMIE